MLDDDPQDTPKTFTQDEVDKIVKDRLARAKKDVPADYDELKDKAKKYDEAQASGKSNDEQTSEKLAQLEKDLADERHLRLKAEVAAAKGLTPAQAKRLNGSSREELETDADDLLENLPAPKGETEQENQGPPSRRPRADLKGGTDPTESPVETDPAKLAALVPRL